ncbi:hypothetical protein FS749_007019, partial [Ceratobasidium sp. UAMH 11750]
MAVFGNFKQVTAYVDPNRTLYRGSSPNYTSGDSSQRLDQAAIDFLQSKKITCIISFNSIQYQAGWITQLRNLGIEYHWLPVTDFTAASIDQLKQTYQIYTGRPSGSSTLIHCGAGYGRTGTGVSAVQLQRTKGEQLPDRKAWDKDNEVEED